MSTGECTAGAGILDEDDTFQLRSCNAFWRLCEQRIVATSTAKARHAEQLQVDRAGVSSDVRVIQLRTTTATKKRPPATGRMRWGADERAPAFRPHHA